MYPSKGIFLECPKCISLWYLICLPLNEIYRVFPFNHPFFYLQWNPWFDIVLQPQSIVCQKIRLVSRVLGIYSFDCMYLQNNICGSIIHALFKFAIGTKFLIESSCDLKSAVFALWLTEMIQKLRGKICTITLFIFIFAI